LFLLRRILPLLCVVSFIASAKADRGIFSATSETSTLDSQVTSASVLPNSASAATFSFFRGDGPSKDTLLTYEQRSLINSVLSGTLLVTLVALAIVIWHHVKLANTPAPTGRRRRRHSPSFGSTVDA
jgi:hypothetical protein